jgi:predicted kinase
MIHSPGSLLVMSGLPAVGKSTLSKALAVRLPAFCIRIDAVEQGLRDAGMAKVHAEGYAVAYRLAEENLRLGFSVVADGCNPLSATRMEWRSIAGRLGVRLVEIEVTCSDRREHRRRVEGRLPDIPGHRLPTWQDVEAMPYDAWESERLVIDTASISIDEATRLLFAHLSRNPRNTPA